MQAYFRSFRTRGVYASIPAYKRVMNDEFQNHIGPDLLKLHDLTTADWKKRPEFKVKMVVEQQGITVSVSATGNDRISMIWNALNKGIPGRVIRPNPSRRRVRIASRRRSLGRKYRRNTKIIGRLRRPTALKFIGRSGETVFRKSVNWKGIITRKYTINIADEYRPIFLRRMENANRRAVHAAQREGS